MESQHVNNLVCILIMHFVDSITMLFHASHIGFSSRVMLLSVCFICSLGQVHYTVIPNNPPLHFILSLEFLLLDNRFRFIWNLLIVALSLPASQADCPGSWVKAVKVVISTWNDNLPAVLRTHSLLHITWSAVTAFLIQPWVLCCALIHLIRSRGRLIIMSAIDWEFWLTTV